MNWVVTVGDVAAVVTAIGGISFLLLYGYVFDWRWSERRRNEFSWHLMSWVAAATALDVYRTWLIFIRQEQPDGEVFRLIVYVLLMITVYWRLLILFRSQVTVHWHKKEINE